MSSLLCQIIAVEPRVKSGAYSLITKLHHDTQRTQQGGPFWATTKFSGALSADRVAVLLKRVEALQEAVAFAREQANTLEVTDRKVAAPLFEYLFAT